MSRYDERLRVVRYDDGAARLAALRATLEEADKQREIRRNQPPVTVEQAREQFARVQSGSKYPPEPEAPLCIVGPRIYMQHELGRDGHCARCHWRFPALTLNGR